MIKIDKSYPAPEHLLTLTPPQKPEEVDGCNYNGPGVKDRLMRDQYGKCCYCECRLDRYADIEHFRPKKEYVGTDGVKHVPGYYWLTCDWDNLLLSCPTCNRSYKKNNFGLIDESKRRIGRKDISQEEPLLVNPVLEDPVLHIGFRKEVAVAINDSCRGGYTIEVLKLNRKDLCDLRYNKYSDYCREKKKLEIALRIKAFIPDMEKDAEELAELSQLSIHRMESRESEFLGVVIHQIED